MRTTALPGAFRAAAAGLLAAALSIGVLAGAPTPARADTAPVADPTGYTPPQTVTADSLPTTQINGVVWDQVVVGSTVYVAGRFTTARPAGAAAGTSEVSRNNLLAYNLQTGVLVSSFNPNLNAQAYALAVSPDQRTLYVGGEFTRVGSTTRNRIAAFDVASGALTSFAPSVSGVVKALGATASAVYLGGTVSAVGGVSRTRLAAVSPAGALLPWAPVPGVGPTSGNRLPPELGGNTRNSQTSNEVKSLVVTNGGSQVVVSGHFYTLNGQAASGVGALDAATGATNPFEMGTLITNQGVNSAIYSLSTDGTTVYGTGYDYYGPGNLEGSFAATAAGGTLQWINSCLGDTYSSVPFNGALYMAGHPHNCDFIGGFPEQDPRVSKYATAVSLTPQGTNRYNGWGGRPAPQELHWFPDLNVGSITGAYQAGWDITASGDYLLYGGEFTRAGGTGQQGLVRYAMPNVAPKKVGPVSDAGITPTALSVAAGSVRVTWTSAYDNDNANLTYRVFRSDKPSTPVFETTAASVWWSRPTLGFVDRNVTAGTSYTYRVTVVDPDGNSVTRGSATVRASSATLSAYSQKVLADGATGYWPLESVTGTTSYDYVGLNDVTTAGGLTQSDGSPTTTTSLTADGTSGARGTVGASGAAQQAPNTFSLELWFNTTSPTGRLAGFGDSAAGQNNSYDRQLFLDGSGRLVFGVYPGRVETLRTNQTVNDGQWHHVVAELSPEGQTLYVDGVKVGTDRRTTTGQDYRGWWQLGWNNLGGWADVWEYRGQLAQAAVYPTALTTAQVRDHYTATGRTLTTAPAPADAYGAAVVTDEPSLFWRLGESGGQDSAADLSGNGNSGFYRGDVVRGRAGVPLVGVTGNTAVDLDNRFGYVVAANRSENPTTFSVESWFSTTSTNGGRIVGFGSSQDQWSGNYDRSVYMFNDGRLRFGVWGPGEQVIDTPRAYNDGDWHQVVATFGANGMALYVDGQLVGSGPGSNVAAYDGYWRVGSDSIWGGANTASLDGLVDEFSVFDKVLTPAQVAAHWTAAGQASSTPSRPADAYGAAVYDSVPQLFWRMDDAAGSSAAAGSAPSGGRGTYTGGPTLAVAGPPLAGTSANTAVSFDGVDDGLYSRTQVSNPLTFTTELWFQTTTTRGGKLIGFANQQSGYSGAYDRHVYLEPSGQLTFGAWTGQANTITSPAAYNDGKWHQVTATMGADGMKLYVDGNLVGTNANTGAQDYAGFWRVGGDNSWSGDPYVNATIDEVAVYDRVLPATEVSAHFRASGLGPDATPVSRFTATADGMEVTFDGSTSSDVEGPIAAYTWDFGDGSTSTGTPVSHRYETAGDHEVTLTVTDSKGQTSTSTQTVTTTAPPPNRAPTAAFTATATGLGLAVDGSGSADSDGTIASWTWEFGDGTQQSGRTATHTYASDGTYPVRLTVTDDDGATASTTQSVTVATPNQAPTAVIGQPTTADLAVTLDGRGSSDADGTVAAYAWEFGDGATGTGAQASHTYSAGGTYTVRLTVTDDDGATGTTTTQVTVAPAPPANVAPTAALTATTSDRTVSVDGRSSTDTDGQVVSWSWAFGDGATATGSTATHAYATAGTYTVTLTVTDDKGATATATRDVIATDPPNRAPSAGITVSGSALTVAVDGRSSADPDGTIASWAWFFGDGGTATGSTASHTYATPGTYTVTLTVTDNGGATGSTTREVTVAPASPTVRASDAFGRTVNGGLGNADLGGTWIASYGAARLSVTPGTAQLALTSPTNQTGAYLQGVSSTAVDVRTSVSLSGAVTGGGTTVYVAGRRVGLNQEYRLRLRYQANGAVGLAVTRLAGSATETVLGSEVTLPGRYTAGQVLQVSLRVTGTGTTAISGSVWADGDAAPTSPMVSRTDTIASLQAAGSVGLTAYLSGSATSGTVARFGALTVTDVP